MAFIGTTLRLDPKTGFLEPGDNYSITGFSAERKLKFLDAVMENPAVGYACWKIGVKYETFQNHYKIDKAFAAAYQKALEESRQLHAGEIQGVMLTRAKNPNGFMDRMAWLRHHFPGQWGDQKTVTVNHVNNAPLISKATEYIDAELVTSASNTTESASNSTEVQAVEHKPASIDASDTESIVSDE